MAIDIKNGTCEACQKPDMVLGSSGLCLHCFIAAKREKEQAEEKEAFVKLSKGCPWESGGDCMARTIQLDLLSDKYCLDIKDQMTFEICEVRECAVWHFVTKMKLAVIA